MMLRNASEHKWMKCSTTRFLVFSDIVFNFGIRPGMTEKLLTGTLNLNKTKTKSISENPDKYNSV